MKYRAVGGDLKRAMAECGFQYEKGDGRDWHFNILLSKRLYCKKLK